MEDTMGDTVFPVPVSTVKSFAILVLYGLNPPPLTLPYVAVDLISNIVELPNAMF
jgi:hypothetical protein